MATWVIVGCGYTGLRAARALAERREPVIVTRRDPAAAEASARAAGPGVRGIPVDLDDPSSLDAIAAGSIIVCCAPPTPRGPGSAGHPLAGKDSDAIRDLAIRAARLVYVSSTGVYPPARGTWVDESQPVAPATDAGRARVAAEAAIANAASWIALRAAGIYGPERNLVERIRAGTYRVVGDGHACVSRIHVDDLVTAIVRAGESAVTGPVNVADDDPAPLGEVADAIAARLGVPPPPRVSASEVTREIAAMLTADRRIANRRMKQELGVALRYPSWRDGLAELLPPAP